LETRSLNLQGRVFLRIPFQNKPPFDPKRDQQQAAAQFFLSGDCARVIYLL
jgi:hypothetical protein